MKESDFHRITPMDMMAISAKMVCTKCGSNHGECDCWIKCECGWSYYKLSNGCVNPDCFKTKTSE